MSAKMLLRRIYRKLLINFRKLTLFLAKTIFLSRFLQKRLAFSYYPGEVVDGLGAQLQRIIALRGLGSYLGISVLSTKISDFAIHPLDGLSQKEYETNLGIINSLLVIESQSQEKAVFNVYIKDLHLIDLLRGLFLSFKMKKVILLCIRDSYFLVDTKPELYRAGISHEMSATIRTLVIDDFSDAIVLHHRQGVGQMAIQPGQKSTREMQISSYANPLKEALNLTHLKRIVIFTDAPETDLVFIPPKSQENLWNGLPKFESGQMQISRGDFQALAENFPQITEVRRGGNPLVSLAEMSTAGALILSRSSFGYLAAHLSGNKYVWIPSDFWHPKIPLWREY